MIGPEARRPHSLARVRARAEAPEAVLETASGERRVTVTVRGTRAEVRREGARDSFTPAGDPGVTTALEWSDVFELVHRCGAVRRRLKA